MDDCLRSFSSVNVQNSSLESTHAIIHLGFLFHSPFSCYASGESPSNTEYDSEPKPDSNKRVRPKARTQSSKDVASGNGEIGSADAFPTTIPRKPRHAGAELEIFLGGANMKTIN
ncbi:hypothetical protein Ahy_B10g106518 [Arachis hypogaea]|uniref:Uncharacterized protein n=1 Tax=Arachis hypogaea TaxID=3818 RepID=A0A444XB45_ARAHY|nr:hypothetical protein Ahy_B10g106518 [Arachis hypogaea]